MRRATGAHAPARAAKKFTVSSRDATRLANSETRVAAIADLKREGKQEPACYPRPPLPASLPAGSDTQFDAPSDDPGLHGLCRCKAAPRAIRPMAGIREDVGADMVLAKQLTRCARRRRAGARKFGQSPSPCLGLFAEFVGAHLELRTFVIVGSRRPITKSS